MDITNYWEFLEKFIKTDFLSEYIEYTDNWHQCPWCLWVPDREWDLVHTNCRAVDLAYLVGLDPKGKPTKKAKKWKKKKSQ